MLTLFRSEDPTGSISDADGSGSDGIELSIIQQGSGNSNVSVTSESVQNSVVSGNPTRWRLCVSIEGSVYIPATGFIEAGQDAADAVPGIISQIPNTFVQASQLGNSIRVNGNFEAPIDVALEFDEFGTVSSNVTSTKTTTQEGKFPVVIGLNANEWSAALPVQAGVRSISGAGLRLLLQMTRLLLVLSKITRSLVSLVKDGCMLTR